MCDELIILEYFFENDKTVSRKRRREMREQSDPFELDDREFIKRYRLTKALVSRLCDEIRPLMKTPIKSTDLSVETKVLTALSFYATGSYQRPIGDIGGHAIAQQTVSKVIAEVTACLNTSAMRKKYISFPKTLNERNRVRARFYQNFAMPGILGCIDCTQVAIVRPHQNEERYYCRKQYHSLNVQLVCDAEMTITSVDASYGGATHDSFIWNVHPLKTYLENVNESTWLIGDSGYPLRKYLLTPIVDAAPGSPEAHYTNVHVRARNTIERTIGLLKARFRCLLVHRALHYKPEAAASITIACVILHNICNKANVAVPELSNEDMLLEVQMQIDMNAVRSERASNNRDLQQGLITRDALIHRLWESR